MKYLVKISLKTEIMEVFLTGYFFVYLIFKIGFLNSHAGQIVRRVLGMDLIKNPGRLPALPGFVIRLNPACAGASHSLRS
jgi:hypothetical protein